MSIHISCAMYLRLRLHVQIRLYCVLPYKAKVSAQHGIGFILDRCIVYLGLTMPNLQKKRPLIFEIFNIKKCTIFLEPSIELADLAVVHIFHTPLPNDKFLDSSKLCAFMMKLDLFVKHHGPSPQRTIFEIALLIMVLKLRIKSFTLNFDKCPSLDAQQ